MHKLSRKNIFNIRWCGENLNPFSFKLVTCVKIYSFDCAAAAAMVAGLSNWNIWNEIHAAEMTDWREHGTEAGGVLLCWHCYLWGKNNQHEKPIFFQSLVLKSHNTNCTIFQTKCLQSWSAGVVMVRGEVRIKTPSN